MTRLLCFLALHRVDSWNFRQSNLRGEPLVRVCCIQEGLCQRCESLRDRLHHDWMESKCTRCGAPEPVDQGE